MDDFALSVLLPKLNLCSVCNLLHVTILALGILRWFLDFWKISASVMYVKVIYIPVYSMKPLWVVEV
jgi:hypothetical protein